MFGLAYVRTQDLMRDVAVSRGETLDAERRAMQKFGEQLDTETGGAWVADEVAELIASGAAGTGLVVVDAVRIVGQIGALRSAFPSRVTHIHVHAPAEVLAARYKSRDDSGLVELSTYEEVASNPTEANVSSLEVDADVSIDTSRSSERDVLARAIAALGLSSSRSERLVDVFIGGQYGSEGKGNVVYHLANEYDVLMRVGGPNAGHKVPTQPDPYTHRLLPSGTLANSSAILLIGPGATLDLDVLLQEIADCGVESGRLFIDPQAMVIEPEDRQAEEQMKKDIGSTGKGGGAAAARRIMGRSSEVAPPVRLAKNVTELAAYIRPTGAILEMAFRAHKKVMLEGTQGTLLSLFHGFYPWVTSRDTTTSACLAEAGIGPHRLRRVVMVVRTYPIRVGNPPSSSSGQMSQEIDWDVIAKRASLDEAMLREREKGSVSGSKRRVAEFDWELLRRASELNGATDIAVTFADYLDAANQNARRFDQLTTETIHFVEEVERVAGAPVSLVCTGFDARSMIDRREW
ncbi:MAG: adenylosuccinate synthase [Rhodoglobus sp.]|nr:adenylosuccinate synthase [Rhodoglobus sp.]